MAMDREQANALLNRYGEAFEKAAVARRGSRKRQSYSLMAAALRVDIINAMTGAEP